MMRASKACVLGILGVCGMLALAAVAPSAARADEPTLTYRGAGKTREMLNAMQLKPFDQSLWSNLSDWNGAAPKAEDLNGKVILIVTWASWYRYSQPAMRSAESLYEKYKDKGLVVVGVHNPTGFDKAAENAKSLGVTFPFAADKDGKFRGALHADQDPNIYFIDRAGNIRFAGLDPSSMEAAADYLVAETTDAAKSYPTDLAKRRADADKKRWSTQDLGARPDQDVSVDFPEPDDEAYTKTRWPYLVGKTETDPIFDKIKNEAPKAQGWPEEGWAPAAPKRNGKLVVVYYADPKEPDLLNAIPTMNRIADEYHRNVIVVLSLYKKGENSVLGNNGGGAGDEETKIVERNHALIPSLRATRPINHFITPRTIRYENIDFSNSGFIPRLMATRDEAGVAVVLSSDLRMRWVGNPYNPDLRIAIEKLSAVDPGVLARRKAEAAKGIK